MADAVPLGSWLEILHTGTLIKLYTDVYPSLFPLYSAYSPQMLTDNVEKICVFVQKFQVTKLQIFSRLFQAGAVFVS